MLETVRVISHILHMVNSDPSGVDKMRECGDAGVPVIPGLQHLGGKQTRAAAQRPSEGVSVDA